MGSLGLTLVCQKVDTPIGEQLGFWAPALEDLGSRARAGAGARDGCRLDTRPCRYGEWWRFLPMSVGFNCMMPDFR